MSKAVDAISVHCSHAGWGGKTHRRRKIMIESERIFVLYFMKMLI